MWFRTSPEKTGLYALKWKMDNSKIDGYRLNCTFLEPLSSNDPMLSPKTTKEYTRV